MRLADLGQVSARLAEPHVARWFLSGSTVEDELDDLRRAITGEEPTHELVVQADGRDIGWCQWYRCADYPAHAEATQAPPPDDAGIDYAIGDPACLGHGLGTALIARLVNHIRATHPAAGVIADPEAANLPSRRVLEKNQFVLLAERQLPTEPTNALMAIYRLPPHPPFNPMARRGRDRVGDPRPKSTAPTRPRQSPSASALVDRGPLAAQTDPALRARLSGPIRRR